LIAIFLFISRKNVSCQSQFLWKKKKGRLSSESRHGDNLAFPGGTATRIIHSNTRFSEDLDFDNLGLNKQDFKQLAADVEQFLFVPGGSKKALFFLDYIKNYKF